MAVATSASEMPGATMASVACCTLPSEEKALMMPHTVPNRPTYGLVLPTVASVARLCSSRSISLSCATRMARREPSSSCSASAELWRRRANSRKPNSKMPAIPVAPPCASMARYSCARSSPDQKRLSKRSASRRARLMPLRLLKMIAQEVSEASSSSPITNCTGTLACTIRRRIDSWSPMARPRRGQRLRQKSRQPLRPQGVCIDTGDAHVRLQQQLPAVRARRAVDALREAQRGRPLERRLAGDLQLVIEARRGAVVNAQAYHREQNAGVARQLLLRVTAGAQPFGARPFEVAQVVGVIDDGAAIGVLPVDACRPGEPAHRGSSNNCRFPAARSGGWRPKCR